MNQFVDIATAQVKAQLAAADAVYGSGQIAQAVDILRALTSQAQPYFRPFYNLGYYLSKQGDHSGAISAMDAALARMPKYADALMVKAKSLTALNRHKEAFFTYEAACAIAPEHVQYKRGYFNSLAQMKKEVVDLGYGFLFDAELRDRVAEKRAMPNTVLEAHHTSECRVVPTREEMLSLLPKNGIVAEVGVAFGDFSKELLNRMQPETLHLIDTWQGERYQSGLERVTSRFNSEIACGTVQLLQGRSVESLSRFPDETFDFIYIDTDHSYTTTIAELEVARSKAKKYGRIGGHDYCTGNVVGAVPYGVVEACAEFCSKRNWAFEYLSLESHGHFSYCLMPIQDGAAR